jgi:hypothetical protein
VHRPSKYIVLILVGDVWNPTLTALVGSQLDCQAIPNTFSDNTAYSGPLYFLRMRENYSVNLLNSFEQFLDALQLHELNAKSYLKMSTSSSLEYYALLPVQIITITLTPKPGQNQQIHKRYLGKGDSSIVFMSELIPNWEYLQDFSVLVSILSELIIKVLLIDGG